MNEHVELALKGGLVTLAVLFLARSLATQVGYGFVNGAIRATTKAEKEGLA